MCTLCFCLSRQEWSLLRNDGFAGSGPEYDACVDATRKAFKLGAEHEGKFDFLGRRIVQHDDFSVSVDQRQFTTDLETIDIPKERRRQPNALVTKQELHNFRSLVGQLAWPARQTMPGLSYIVSDL